MSTRGFLIACLSAAFTLGSLAAQPALGAWGDGAQRTAVTLEGKRFFVHTEAGKFGPFDYAAPVARAASGGNRVFVIAEKQQYYLVSCSGERLGPYRSVYDEDLGCFFICTKPGDARVYDLYYDDGSKLVLAGTTSLVSNIEDCYRSPDGRHFVMFAGGLITDPEYLFFDGRQLAINHRTKTGKWDIGFAGEESRFWLKGEESETGSLLLFVEPQGEGVLVSALSAAPGYPGNRMPFPEALLGLPRGLDGREPLRILSFGNHRRSPDGRRLALSILTAEGWRIYDGEHLYGPYGEDPETGKLPLALSPDGRALAYVVRAPNGGSGQARDSLYRNGELLATLEGQRWVDLRLTEAGECVALTRDEAGGYSLWVDGQLILGGCQSASLEALEPPSSAYLRDANPPGRFLGHASLRKDGRSHLYLLDRPVAGGHEAPGSFRLEAGRNGEPVVLYLESKEGAARVISAAGASEPWQAILGATLSEQSGQPALRVKDPKGKHFVILGGRKFGPYEVTSEIRFLPGSDDFVFFYSKGKAWFLGKSDGTSLPLPGFGYTPNYSGDRSVAPILSPDGRVIEYPAAPQFYFFSTKRSYPINSRRVLVDGRSFVGAYNPEASLTVYWDEKTGSLATLEHARSSE